MAYVDWGTKYTLFATQLATRLAEEDPRTIDIVQVVRQAVDEGFVDFQHVQRQAFEVAERGVAGTEIVDGQLQAECLEIMKDLQGLLGAVHDEAFGDLQLQALRVEAAAA